MPKKTPKKTIKKEKKTTTRPRTGAPAPREALASRPHLPAKRAPVKKEIKKSAAKPAKYFAAVGSRKTAVARVRFFTQGEKTFSVNKKSLEAYFPTFELQQTVTAPLAAMKCLDKFKISAIVKGGGSSSQAQALSHGIARALVLFNPDFRKRLKKGGYLTRDPRMRERKKFGLKRARRAPQWSKR